MAARTRPPAAAPARVDEGSTGAARGSLVTSLGGPKKAAMLAGAVAVGGLALYRKHKSSTAAANASANNLGLTLGSIPAGYSNTATDPTQVYTGWDQLEQQIQALQNQLNNPGTAANHNPTPKPPIIPIPPVGTRPPVFVPGPPSPIPAPTPPGPVARPAPPPGPHQYTVVKGDTLWGIAQKDTGNGQNWQQIYQTNKSVIGSNPDLIFPGEKLTIP